MASNEEDENETTIRLKLAVRQMAGSLTEDDYLLPEVAIVGKGPIFCYSPSKRRFVKLERGGKAFIIEKATSIYNKVLIFTFSGHLVEIEESELLHTGCD
tara:strand:- start:274 stop:573 length:300 start_codon:yes stop_codon:yes gene_type:complete